MGAGPETTLGQRIFQVRLALGDGVRKPLSMRDFAALLSRTAGREPPYSVSFISRWENGESEPRLDELVLIAHVDPLRRGAPWLAFNVPTVADVGKNGDAVTLRPATPDPFRATGTVVPHEAYREATTPTAAELEAEEREAAHRRRPGATGRKRRA